MNDRKAMQQALEALEMLSQQPIEMALDYADNAIDVLRDRLAQPEQEAQTATYTCGVCGVSMQMEQPEPDGLSWLKKDSNYFSQPQRKPLTDERCDNLWAAQLFDITDRFSARDFIRDVEAAHGIKGET